MQVNAEIACKWNSAGKENAGKEIAGKVIAT